MTTLELRELFDCPVGTPLPPWAAPMAATDAGVARYRAWRDRGRPTPTRAELARRLVVVGDQPARDVILDVLVSLPPAAAEAAVSEAHWLALGRGSAGFCTVAPPWPATGTVPFLIVLDARRSDAALRALVAHEAAHLWLAPPCPVEQNVPPVERAERRARIVELADMWGYPERARAVFDRRARTERLAVDLQRAWGYPLAPEERAGCIRGAVRMLAEEIHKGGTTR